MAALANPTVQYVDSVAYAAVAAWQASHAYTAGTLVRQLATPAVGSERVFVCTVAGTSNSSEPSYTLTKGAKTTDNTATWQECTGIAALNGDATNIPAWTANAKGNTVALGQVIKRDSNGSLQICTTAGTAGSGAEPSFSNTAGTTTTDNTVTWTSLGAPGNFGLYAAPHARFNNANTATWAAAGDTIYISDQSAETAAAATLIAGVGTFAALVNALCVDRSAVPPTSLATTASISTTGANSLTIGQFEGYMYGVTLSAGDSTNAASVIINGAAAGSASIFLDHCKLKVNNTNTGSTIQIGASTTNIEYTNIRDCDFIFGNASQFISYHSGTSDIIGGTVAATGTVPTIMAKMNTNGRTGFHRMRGVDLSAINTTLASLTAAATGFLDLWSCKLNASVAMHTGSMGGHGSPPLRVMSSDSSGTINKLYEQSYEGTTTSETTITRQTGSSDGTTLTSWKMVSTANIQFAAPMVLEEIVIPYLNSSGSSKTLTLEVASSGTLTNGDLWMEVEYLGDSGSPKTSIVSTRKANILSSTTNLTTSSATWNSSPGTTMKMAATFTPQLKGPVKVRVMLAKPSTTVYIDPKPVVT